jgi:hypothetical protein
MEWPTSKYNPITATQGSTNVLQSLQQVKQQNDLRNALAAAMQGYQQTGEMNVDPVMAVDPNAAAQMQSTFAEMQEQQRLGQFRDLAGQYVQARAMGQDFDELPLWRNFHEEMLELDADLATAEKKEFDQKVSYLTHNLLSLKAANKVMRGVTDLKSYQAGLNQIANLGFDVSSFPAHYDPAVRDAFADEAQAAATTMAMMFPPEPKGSFGEFLHTLRQDDPGTTIEEGIEQWRSLKEAGAPKSEVTITSKDTEGLPGNVLSGEDYTNLKELTTKAHGGIEQLYTIDQLEGLMGKDLYLGAGADVRLFAGKVFSMLGVADEQWKDKMADTEAARALLIELALPKLKNFPGQLSEKEMEAAFRTIGTTAEEKGTLRRIMDSVKRGAMRDIKRQREDVEFYKELGIKVQPSFNLETPDFGEGVTIQQTVDGMYANQYEKGTRYRDDNGVIWVNDGQAWRPQ